MNAAVLKGLVRVTMTAMTRCRHPPSMMSGRSSSVPLSHAAAHATGAALLAAHDAQSRMLQQQQHQLLLHQQVRRSSGCLQLQPLCCSQTLVAAKHRHHVAAAAAPNQPHLWQRLCHLRCACPVHQSTSHRPQLLLLLLRGRADSQRRGAASPARGRTLARRAQPRPASLGSSSIRAAAPLQPPYRSCACWQLRCMPTRGALCCRIPGACVLVSVSVLLFMSGKAEGRACMCAVCLPAAVSLSYRANAVHTAYVHSGKP